MRIKRILSAVLAMVMVVVMMPVGVSKVEASDNVKAKLDAFISIYPNGSRWTGSFGGGIQCFGFAKMVVYELFGMSNGQYRAWDYAGNNVNGMQVIGSTTSFSYNNVKNLLSNAKCGDVLQFNTTKQHTMIVYAVESDGVWIYDCNWDWNCGISLRKSQFGNWSSRDSSKLTLLRANNYSDVTPAHTVDSAYGTNFTAYPKARINADSIWDANHNQVSSTAWIGTEDLCTIHEVYTDGCCRVTYPLGSGGTKTVYSKVELFNVQAPSRHVDIGTSFTAPILNRESWRIIENNNGIVQTAYENGKANQLWYFERQSDGSYKISSCSDGGCLDVNGGSSEVRTKVQVWGSNDTDAQRWYIYEQNGGYVLKAKCTDCVLDMPENDSTPGNQLIMYTRHDGSAQIWAIYQGEECKLSSPALSVSTDVSGKNTTFTWDDVYGELGYDVKIWKDKVWDGDPYHVEWGATSGYSIQLPDGTYEAYVDATNHFDCKMSNVVRFTVYKTTATISINRTQISVGENIIFSLGGNNNGVIDMAIFKDDVLVESISGIRESTLTKTFTETGSYKAFVTGYSNFGGIGDSDYVYWEVKPLSATVSVDRQIYTPNEAVTFTFGGYNNSTYDDGVVDMAIFRDDVLVENISGIGESTLTKTFTETGSYKAFITGYSNAGYDVESDYIYWIITSDSLPGDVDGDGEVTITDISALSRYLTGAAVDITTGADINHDGNVTTTDLAELRRIIA